MGLTRQYLRYAPQEVFGLTASNKANVVLLDIKGVQDKYCAVGACENVIVWDVRTGEKVFTLKGGKHEVTKVAKSPDKEHIAVGYNDGQVCVFNLYSGDMTITFNGHKSTVTALKFDHRGLRLVSGAKDTDVIVWDIVNECGLYRLKGHKGLITQAVFLKDKNVLVSSSKDTYVKFWDLDTQHCFKTLVEHRSEVYDFVLLKEDTRLITGSADSELRMWDIHYTSPQDEADKEPEAKKSRLEEEDSDEETEELNILQCKKVGSIMRSGRDRLMSIAVDSHESTLVCHGNDRSLQVFAIPNEEELKKTLHKRQKKEKKKHREKTGEEAPDSEVSTELKPEDQLKRVTDIKMMAKIASADLVQTSPGNIKVVCLFNNNTLGHCTVNCEEKNPVAENVGTLTLYGHQSDVRTISFSSDNTALLTASAESVKIWNRASLQCIRTMSCDYALCSVFAPGDRHIVIGTKSGKLQIFDIGSGAMLEDVEAHTGAVWSLCLSPDKRGLVSGSADKQVKFWNFELVSDEENTVSSKQLTVQHTRSLQMDDDVLCVKYSPNQRLLAVSLLDNTVKVFFSDTLKFFLSLYGHKLPVLCIDISSDSTLLVSGSADRNVKIWGLDFGDCHKSIFAHDDSIMCIQFVPKTHLFFSGGKDRKIKQWDADNFENIITLEGHHAEVWCLAISPSGNVLASGSHDKSVRLWEKTEEPLELEDEREMQREKQYEDNMVHGDGQSVIPGETNTEAGLAGKKSIETVKAAERLMEALELYNEEKRKWEDYHAECKLAGKKLPEPEPHTMMVAFNASTPEKFVLAVLKKIKSSELEETMLVLPFNYVIDFLKLLDRFVSSGWEVELSCRCLLFLARVHQGQIITCQELLPVVDRLRRITVDKVKSLRDRIGFNLAGLKFLKEDIEQSQETVFFMDATSRSRQKKRAEKKKVVLAIKT